MARVFPDFLYSLVLGTPRFWRGNLALHVVGTSICSVSNPADGWVKGLLQGFPHVI